MPQGIRISCPDDSTGPIIRYVYQLYNDSVSVQFDVHGNDDELINFGRQLQQYPLVYSAATAEYRAVFQKGKNRRRFLWYFRIEVFVYKTNGAAAVRIVYDNNAEEEYSNRAEFTIRTSAASVIELGGMLAAWAPGKQPELAWAADE